MSTEYSDRAKGHRLGQKVIDSVPLIRPVLAVFLMLTLTACGDRSEETNPSQQSATASPSAATAIPVAGCGEETETTLVCDTCLSLACFDQHSAVYGVDFPGGQSGVCAVYLTCIDACGCEDSRCEAECSFNRDRDCIQAMSDLETCEHAACEESCAHLQATPEPDLWCATTETELVLDEPITGTLSSTDPTDGIIGSTPYKRYPLSLVRDRKIGVEMNSTEFDTYLALFDERCNLVTFADDGGTGEHDARLTYTPPLAGTYYVEATTRDITGVGTFQLEAAYSVCDEVIRNLPPDVIVSGDLESGDRVNGHYDGAYYDLYGIVVEENEPWVVTLDSNIDSQALILRDRSCHVIDTATSRLSFTTTLEGYLFIEVSAQEPGATGSYTLDL